VSPDLDQRRHRRGDRGGNGVAAATMESMYPVVFFDALRVKIRDEATVMRKGRLSGPWAILPGWHAWDILFVVRSR
jgi:hypothetical protein